MRILIATPLFPPDIEPSARYIKELAARLKARHQVTILAFTRLPEAIPGVTILSVDKKKPRLVRIFTFFIKALVALQTNDIVYVQNGPSVELPIRLAMLIRSRPVVLGVSDQAEYQKSARANAARRKPSFIQEISAQTITDMPVPKPEIIPLDPKPVEELRRYELSWQKHLTSLESALSHATSY